MNLAQLDFSLLPDLQTILEASSNPLAKSRPLAQYYTPPSVANELAKALPAYRPVLVDLTCGPGQLLQGCANNTTRTLIGCDIATKAKGSRLNAETPELETSAFSIQHSDLTLFYPLLAAIDWQADLFVLNPPWDLHWHKERLSLLADSGCRAVASVFTSAFSLQPSALTLDSTIATWMIALDRLTYRGEGLLIANHATLERLVFRPNAPYHALATHVWHRRLMGKAEGERLKAKVSESEPSAFSLQPSAFPLEAVYFCAESGQPERAAGHLPASRDEHHMAPDVTGPMTACSQTKPAWDIAAGEWKERARVAAGKRPKENLSLDGAGNIQVHLSVFAREAGQVGKLESGKVGVPALDREQIVRLFALQGARPLQVVMQRATRDELLYFLNCETICQPAHLPTCPPAAAFTISPELRAAVTDALAAYNAVRAPLYPLSEIQRLGYLDEHDRVECKKDFDPSYTVNFSPRNDGPMAGAAIERAGHISKAEGQRLKAKSAAPETSAFSLQPSALFSAGQRYALRTATVAVVRLSTRRNLQGEEEEILLTGKELVIYIKGDGRWKRGDTGGASSFELAFMHEPALAPALVLEQTAPYPVLPLPALVDHFTIPDVPDVAAANPEKYQQNLQQLDEIMK